MAQGHSPEKPFFDALLAEKNVLWPAIMRCNAYPRMRTEFTSPLAANSFESLKSWLAGSPDSVRTEESEQDVVFFWDFSEDSRKLALLDDDQLSRLAAVVGVALHAPALARIITRKERLACREALGDELFDYALVRGQYQSGEATTIVAQRDLEVPLPERCRRHGWLALYLCSLPWPKELRMAFHRRLGNLCHGASTAVSSGDALKDTAWHALWRLLKRCLLWEVAPSWKPYFTA